MKKQLFLSFLFLSALFAVCPSDGYASATVLSDKEIKNSNASDLASLLSRYIPGVEVSQTSFGRTIHIQGHGVGDGILLLVDGKRQSGAGESFNIDRIPLSSVKEVVIDYGGNVIYGSDASAMVINVITHDADFKGAQVEVEARYTSPSGREFGSHDTEYRRRMDSPQIEASLGASFGSDKFLSQTHVSFRNTEPYLLNGAYRGAAVPLSGDYKPFSVGGSMAVEGSRDMSLSQYFKIVLHPKVTLNISATVWSNSRTNFVGADNFIVPLDYDPYAYDGALKYNSDMGGSGDIDITYRINDKNKIVFDLYGLATYDRFVAETKEPRNKSFLINPSVRWENRPNDKHLIRAGVEMYSRRVQSPLLSGGYAMSHDYNVFSVYAIERFTHKRFFAEGGLRVDNFGWDNLADIYINFVGKPKNMRDACVSPQVAVGYKSNTVTAKASYELGYVFPSIYDMNLSAAESILDNVYHMTGSVVKRNKSHNVRLDGTYESDAFRLSAGLYVNRFKNTVVPQLVGDKLITSNGDSNEYYGATLSASVPLLEGWNINASYNYMRKRDDSVPVIDDYGYRPHTFVANTDYTLTQRNLEWNFFVSASYLSPKDFYFTDPATTIYRINLPSQTIVTAGANLTILGRYRVFVSADNILNSKPDLITQYSPVLTGATVSAGFALTFGTAK